MMFLLLLVPALAFQISPAAKSLTIEQPIEMTYPLRLINDGTAPLPVAIIIPDEYASIVQVTPSTLLLQPGEERINVTLRVDPEALIPGRTLISIMISAGGDGEGQFGGKITLLHNLALNRPYDGSYLETSINLGNGEPLPYAVALVNRGKKLTEVSVTTQVLESDTLLEEASLGSISLAGLSNAKIEGDIESLPSGVYTLIATSSYNDGREKKEVKVKKGIRFGSPSVTILPLTPDLIAGEIVRLELPVLLDWNKEVEAIATAELLSGERRVALSDVSARTTLIPGEEGKIALFVEIPEGVRGEMRLEFSVTEMDGSPLGSREEQVIVTNKTSVPPSEGVEAMSLWPIILLLLFLLFVGLYIYYKRRTA